MSAILFHRGKRALAMMLGVLAAIQPGAASAETVHSVTQVSYDGLKRPVCTATRMDSTQWASQTDACSPQIAGPGGPDRITKNLYDAAGRLIQVRKAVGITLSNGAPQTLEQADATFSYDAVGRRIGVVDANGNRAALNYDGFGRKSQWIFPAINRPTNYNSSLNINTAQPSSISEFCVDAAFSLIAGSGCYGDVNVRQYYSECPYGSSTIVVDGVNYCRTRISIPSQKVYNCPEGYYVTGAMCTQTTAFSTSGGTNRNDLEQYGYDANGNRIELRKRDGRILTFSYDALNRMTSKIIPEGCPPTQAGGCPGASSTRDVYYGYDLRGLQAYARFATSFVDGKRDDADGVVNSYDGLGQLVSSTTRMNEVTRGVSVAYYADGNRAHLTTPGGTWTYTYDGLDRLIGLYEGTSTNSAMSVWKYNPQGLPKSVDERSGSGVSWTYDEADRLTNQSDAFVGGTGNVTAKLEYNSANQITVQGRSNSAYAYSDQYAVARSYDTNSLNQYSSSGDNALTYDANGNMIKEKRPDSKQVDYIYDAENRLIKRDEVSLAYDPLGRLFEVSTSSVNSTQFLYDGDQLVAEYDGGGTLTNTYVHGPGVDDPLLWYPSGNAVRWYHRDKQGSIVATADGASGTLAGINTYDEYGIRGSGNVGRFQYTGQTWLPELGLYHYKARAYSPMLGRFLQTDPIGYDDQVNLYAYVANDPVNGRDPTGMDSFVVGRPLDDPTLAKVGIGHSFIVTDARYPGDPSATVVSFGQLGNGKMGNVNDSRRASEISKTAHATDVASWRAIGKSGEGAFSKINAPDALVGATARAVNEKLDYFAVPALMLNDVNSNSAAAAVANTSSALNGTAAPSQPSSPNVSSLPGYGQAGRVLIDRTQVCSTSGVSCK